MCTKLMAVGLVLGWIPAAVGEVISIASLQRGSGYVFDFALSRLAYYERKCEVDGWEPLTQMFLVTDGAAESVVNCNAGTTQYQGHYVWLVSREVSGFGTYTSSRKSRSFGWIFRNDTGRDLVIRDLWTVFGQWGARNSRPDSLSFEFKVADGFVDPAADGDWLGVPADMFTAPYTNNAPDAVFPYFERRTLTGRPARIPRQAYFAVRFTDTCPPSGSNAHLGLAGFSVVFAARQTGFGFWIR